MPPAARTLNHRRSDWLCFIRSGNVGPITFYQLLACFGSAAAALDALPELARNAGRQRPLGICGKPAAERELAALERAGASSSSGASRTIRRC